MRSIKYLLKVALAIIIFLLIGLAYLFIKYDEDLPVGEEGVAADQLAMKMEQALNKQAYDSTNHIEWAFRNSHFYKWDKSEKRCEVSWKEYKVLLNLNNTEISKAYVHNFQVHNAQARDLIETAVEYFNNDSFWLVAPYKAFDEGVKRSLIKTETGEEALLVTYTKGGTTPGDSYLWLLNKNGKPYAFKMWTQILPFEGIEAGWDHWIKTESGAILPQSHSFLFLTIPMGEVKGYN